MTRGIYTSRSTVKRLQPGLAEIKDGVEWKVGHVPVVEHGISTIVCTRRVARLFEIPLRKFRFSSVFVAFDSISKIFATSRRKLRVTRGRAGLCWKMSDEIGGLYVLQVDRYVRTCCFSVLLKNKPWRTVNSLHAEVNRAEYVDTSRFRTSIELLFCVIILNRNVRRNFSSRVVDSLTVEQIDNFCSRRLVLLRPNRK